METTETQKKWLAAFLLKSSLRLPDNASKVDGQYADATVVIKNVPRANGEDYFLDLKFIIRAADIENAHIVAQEMADEISHTLSFVSATSVRVHKPVYLIDWDPGPTERDQYVYGHLPIVDPLDALDETMWRTVQVVSEHQTTSATRTALRWHSRGNRAQTLEDQFLYHFFAIEILAATESFTDKVTDKCPRCRSDLACSNPDCGRPEHRPFPKQKIGLLLLELGLAPKLIEGLTEVRNLLSHGEERQQIVEYMKKASSSDFELENAVSIIAQASTNALHRALDIPEQEPPLSFYYLENPEHQTMISRFHLRIGMLGDPLNPKVDDVRMPELSAVITDPKTGEVETVHVGGKKLEQKT